ARQLHGGGGGERCAEQDEREVYGRNPGHAGWCSARRGERQWGKSLGSLRICFRWVRRGRGARRCRSTAATKLGHYQRIETETHGRDARGTTSWNLHAAIGAPEQHRANGLENEIRQPDNQV